MNTSFRSFLETGVDMGVGLALLVLTVAAQETVQEKSWVGRTVLIKDIGTQIRQSADAAKPINVAVLHGVDYEVLADAKGWIKVKTGQAVGGWLPKTEAVLLEDGRVLQRPRSRRCERR